MTTQYIYDLVDTWNNGATTFTAIKMNVTDTASGAVSNLLDIGTGGGTYVSKFKVRKDGEAQAVSFNQSGSGGNFLQGGVYISSNNAILAFGGSSDTILSWRAAANLRLGAADAAGSAIAVSSVATNQLTLASSHGLTSGAAVIITGTTAPSGTSLNTLYYARSISAAVIELYLTFDTATATSGTTGIVAVTTAGTSASIRLATPFQRLSPQDFTGTDIPGQPLLINGSRGTGTGPGGSIVFQVAPAGSTGATQNALATALTIDSARTATFAGTILIPVSANSSVSGISNPTSTSSGFYTTNGFDYGYNRAGAATIGFRYSALTVTSGSTIGFTSSSTDPLGTQDVFLARDAANTLALRNGGTNASPVSQQFNVYKFWADASNYSRLEVGNSADANTHYLYATQSGTGTARDLLIGTSGAKDLLIYTNGSLKWTVNSSGHFIAGTDNTYDIGASGATRPRSVFITDTFRITNTTAGNSTFSFAMSGTEGQIVASGGAVVLASSGAASLRVSGGTTPTVQFGGTTSSFPAIKRNGAGIDVVGADGTNVSFVRVPGVAVASLPAAATAGAGARSFVTDANATTYASTVAGGGANKVPVFSDGTNWLIG